MAKAAMVDVRSVAAQLTPVAARKRGMRGSLIHSGGRRVRGQKAVLEFCRAD
jgi:hypothetical protein